MTQAGLFRNCLKPKARNARGRNHAKLFHIKKARTPLGQLFSILVHAERKALSETEPTRMSET